jgi:hypothetical protein
MIIMIENKTHMESPSQLFLANLNTVTILISNKLNQSQMCFDNPLVPKTDFSM